MLGVAEEILPPLSVLLISSMQVPRALLDGAEQLIVEWRHNLVHPPEKLAQLDIDLQRRSFPLRQK